MGSTSQPVQSSQTGCHQQLATVVKRHLRHPSLRPAAQHTQDAFNAIRERIEAAARPIVLDSFCGTGMSTALLAQRYPQHTVIGVDKSAHRLARHEHTTPDGYLLIQAECGDFWRLAGAAGWQLSHHFLLYPNPWPKPGQLQRRVHGSADFSALLALGGQLELRSNWQIYVEEFREALRLAGYQASLSPLEEETALTLHERKYRDSGHPLWRCTALLGDNRQNTVINRDIP